MKQIMTTLFFAAALTAAAQPYAQPVREVDDFQARSAVEAACTLTWGNGEAKGVRACEFYTVPAGKRLAVRSISLYCFVPSATNTLAYLSLGSTLGNTPAPRYIQLHTAVTAANSRITMASEQVFTHYEAGTTLRFIAWYNGNDPQGTNCYPVMNGFLISMN